MLEFNKEDGLDKREEETDMKVYPDKKDMEDMALDNERERHWKMVFKDT